MKIEKIFCLVAVLCGILAFSVAISVPPASGYEISMFDAFPFHFWLLLFTSLGCSIFVVFIGGIRSDKSLWVFIGLAVSLLMNCLFLLLPYVRGYVLFGRYDTLTHLGMVKDILLTGHVGTSNFYPIVHLLATIIVEITGIGVTEVFYFLVALFSVVFTFGIYLLFKSFGTSSGQSLVAAAFSLPLIFSGYEAAIYPAYLSIFFIPYLFSFYHNRAFRPDSKKAYTLLLILTAFFITFCHPITTMYVILIFIFFWVSVKFHGRFIGFQNVHYAQLNAIGKNSARIALLMLVGSVAWYSQFISIQRSFREVITGFLLQIGSPFVRSVTEPLVGARLEIWQFLQVFAARYGAVSLMLVLSIAVSFYVLATMKRKTMFGTITFSYAVTFLVACILGVLFLFGYFPNMSEPVRALTLSLLFGTILSALVVSKSITTKSNLPLTSIKIRKRLLISAVGTALVAMMILSILSICASTLTSFPNDQVTQMDVTGFGWFQNSENSSIPVILNTRAQIERFDEYFGLDTNPYLLAAISNVDLRRLPSHFGYPQFPTIADAIDLKNVTAQEYVVLSGRDKVSQMFYPENVREQVPQFTQDDLVRLSSDPSANQIYDNGETEIWLVHGIR